jgi:hypothetical protein
MIDLSHGTGRVEISRTVGRPSLFQRAKLGQFGQAHCDGLTRDPALSCLPPGESLTTTTTFTVVRRH